MKSYGLVLDKTNVETTFCWNQRYYGKMMSHDQTASLKPSCRLPYRRKEEQTTQENRKWKELPLVDSQMQQSHGDTNVDANDIE